MGKAILIVDDSEDTRELFTLTLRYEGFQVESAVDAEHALEILRSRDDFACVLLDLKMPNMSGLDLLRRLNLEGIAPDLPFVLVSAAENIDELDLPPNVVDTLKKPFFFPELIFKLRQFEF